MFNLKKKNKNVTKYKFKIKKYDFRKYVSNTSTKQKEDLKKIGIESDADIVEDLNHRQNKPEDKKPFSIYSLLNQPITITPYQAAEIENYETKSIPQQLDVTDSFEANLLKQLKAEMEELPKKKASQPQFMPILSKSKNSPIMFDNSNHSNDNTSDKIYNYQVITNSTESTTSVCVFINAKSSSVFLFNFYYLLNLKVVTKTKSSSEIS